MNELVQLAISIGEEVAPGIVTPADAALVGIFTLIAKLAHPNTIAFKVASIGLAALSPDDHAAVAQGAGLLPVGVPAPK